MFHKIHWLLCVCFFLVGRTAHAVDKSTYMLVFENGNRHVAVAAVPLNQVGMAFGVMDSLLLSDGTYASVNDSFRWTVTERSEGGFYLKTQDDRWLLPLVPTSQHAAGLRLSELNEADAYWELTEDGLLTGYVYPSAEPRIMVYRKGTAVSGFTTDTPQALEHPVEGQMSFVRIVQAAPLQRMIRDAGGLVTLEGGWSYQKLKALDWDSITALDLTHIVLPSWPVRWNRRPADSNALVYVSEVQRPFVSKEWCNVVLKADDESQNRALTPIELTDGMPFYVPYEFRVGPDSLVYTRYPKDDGYWESIYLPFVVADWPEDFLLALRKTGDSGAALCFATAAALPAYTPAIFRYVGNTYYDGPMRLTAVPGVVARTVCDDEGGMYGLAGTLRRLDVTDSFQRIYLLNPTGQKFSLAAAQSYVNPFRCYYHASQQEKHDVRFSVADGLVAVCPVTGDSAIQRYDVYNLSGISLIQNGTWKEVREKLIPGLYIINGKVTSVQ